MSRINQILEQKIVQVRCFTGTKALYSSYNMNAEQTNWVRSIKCVLVLDYDGDHRGEQQRFSSLERQLKLLVNGLQKPIIYEVTQKLQTYLKVCKKHDESSREYATVVLLVLLHLLYAALSKIHQLNYAVVKYRWHTTNKSPPPTWSAIRSDSYLLEPSSPTDVECGLIVKHNSQIKIQNPVEFTECGCDEKMEHEKVLYGLHDGISRDEQLLVYVVPHYPEQHNSLIPIRLIERLEAMSPQEYRSYVLHELSLEERESLMIDEVQRRKTFLVGWPHHTNNLNGNKMAQAGLYALGNEDRVQCAFCRGSLHQWEPDDNPMAEHARLFNFCRFVKGLSCGNVEYRSQNLSREDFEHITQFGNTAPTTSEQDIIDTRRYGISTKRATEIRYGPHSARLRTFSGWARTSRPITPLDLCDAGFYFTGFDDQVRCFFCGGGIHDWVEGDDPWEEHARWFPHCSYLIQKKGVEYVEDVHARTPVGKKCSNFTTSEQNAHTRNNTRITNQELMRQCCIELGHSAETIDSVIAANDGPFNNVSAMIEAIYAEEDSSSTHQTMLLPPTPGADTFGNEHIHVSSAMQESVRFVTGSESTIQTCCRSCLRNTGDVVPATHIGLPCGHMIYCDKCNDIEVQRNVGQEHISICPARCTAVLNGTMKVFVC